jgi:hypothetical protein
MTKRLVVIFCLLLSVTSNANISRDVNLAMRPEPQCNKKSGLSLSDTSAEKQKTHSGGAQQIMQADARSAVKKSPSRHSQR